MTDRSPPALVMSRVTREPPEQGLSNTKADDDSDDERDLKGPARIRFVSSKISTMMHRETYMTINMSAKCSVACTACRIPRVMSWAGMNGGPLRIVATSRMRATENALRLLSPADAEVVFSLSAIMICVLRPYQRIHSMRVRNTWLEKSAEVRSNRPLAPVCLHDRPRRGNPPIDQSQQEQSDTGPNHCSSTSRNPSVKQDSVSRRKVHPHSHAAHREIHGAVHAHIHAIAGTVSKCSR